MTHFECPHCEANCAERLVELQRCIVDLTDEINLWNAAWGLKQRPCQIKHAETIKQAQNSINQTKGE